MTSKEMEYRKYRNKVLKLANVGPERRKQLPWIVAFSLLALIASTGEMTQIYNTNVNENIN
jgi:hypothetical protein